MAKVWRDAASLILTARTKQKPTNMLNGDWSNIFDYQVLMLKRSSKSKFMPNAYVFPGGVISKSDLSKDWVDFFHVNGVHASDLELLAVGSDDRPLLMTADSPAEPVKRDIAFRLTALRETFEESGVLLHTTTKAGPSSQESGVLLHTTTKAGPSSQAYTFQPSQQLDKLRKKVHDEPDEFLRLYKDLDLLPDIFSLAEWSDWLTPTDLHEQGRRRFDTIFYSAHLPEKPETILDEAEEPVLENKDRLPNPDVDTRFPVLSGLARAVSCSNVTPGNCGSHLPRCTSCVDSSTSGAPSG